jgi:predicted metal-dependent peptidase
MAGIEQALRQGGVFAGKMGGKMPREISELLKPQVNWRDILKAFVNRCRPMDYSVVSIFVACCNVILR